MGNLLQYTDKSTTIDNKLASLLNTINYAYNNGEIRTETEYYYRIKNMLSDFYKSLTKPTFQYRPAVSTPMSYEYNAMIEEAYQDMEFIIKDCETLGNLIQQSFEDAELGRNMMTDELMYLQKQIKSIGESIARNQHVGNVIFTELFDKKQNIQSSGCFVDTQHGILTLGHVTSNSVDIDSVTVDNNETNCFPGNTHCVDTLNNELHFVGQEGLHNNINAILDTSKESWYECELFEITDAVRSQCNSLGFEFNEGVSWISDDGYLRLKLNLTLNHDGVCSWLTMIPYLSDVKGVKACYLESCNVITTNNITYKLGEQRAFDDTLVFPFPPSAIQKIELTFVQKSKYLTSVGHYYYTSADTTNMSIFQDYDYSDMFARVDGPKPSVSLLGCTYNPSTQWIDYNSTQDTYANETYVASKLFALPESTVDRKANQEIIPAYRYMLGISNIQVASYIFKEYGEYISTPYTTDEPITSVTLESEEYIPGSDVDIIKYYISLNGGLTWHQIYPIHRAYQGIYKYYINNDTIENMLAFDTSQKKSKNLSIIGTCNSVQLKIEMSQPKIKNAEYATPIIYNYKLHLTTGGESIEY